MSRERLMSFEQNSVTIAALAPIDLDGLSYDDYFKKVEEMIKGMKENWNRDQKVKALKAVIRLTKLLADTTQLKLYSKKYKLITDALDDFGKLIFARIQSIATGSLSLQTCSSTSSEENPNNCRDMAKDTCRNWFLKVASIRELVPRFYTELSILKTCDILLTPQGFGLSKEQFYAQSLRRLSKTAYGFGDPIVAIHCRAYLCKVASKLISWNSDLGSDILYELILLNLQSSTNTINHLDSKALSKTVGPELGLFFDIVSHGLQIMLDIIVHEHDIYDEEKDAGKSNERIRNLFGTLLKESQGEKSSLFSNCVIAFSILKTIPADISVGYSQEILNVIQSAQKQCLEMPFGFQNCSVATSILYSTIESYALALDSSETLDSHLEQEARHDLMKSIDLILEVLVEYDKSRNNPVDCTYFRCLKALISYTNHYVCLEEVNKLLNRFVIRIRENRQKINQYSTISGLVKALVSSKKSVNEYHALFTMKSFTALLDLLRKDDHRLETSCWILETMRANLKLNNRQDFVVESKQVIDFTMRIFATINDSLGPMVLIDDINHVSQVIVYFLDRFKVESFEDYLELMSHCRKVLGNMNPVLEYLIEKVLKLPLEHKNVERRRGQRRNYLNGCLAFAFITTPAVIDLITRLRLFIQGSNLALDQVSISIADSYVKQALSCLNDILYPQPDEGNLEEVQIVRAAKEKIHNYHNKALITQIGAILDLMVKHADHVDLKHKLVLTTIIDRSFPKDPRFEATMKCLKVLDDDIQGNE